MKKVGLFGGKIIAQIPVNFADCSEFRQIPDHQEVFVDLGMSDQSLIIEILEKQETDNNSIAEFHFNELCLDNNSVSRKILHKESFSVNNLLKNKSVPVNFIVGEQKISKFNEVHENTVQIYVAVLRILEKKTDIVVSFNNPTSISRQSSSANVTLDNTANYTDYFKSIVESMTITDLSFIID